jgi:pimeloyl-ACP methyl ester carboxylesterase
MPYAHTQGIRLYYEQQGRGAPPLVFVHGYACDHEDWQPQVDFFQSRHHVITCDLPGHGASERHPDHCSIESFGAAVSALLAALELAPAVLIGHSTGCRVVLQAYLTAPERVSGLIFVDGSCVGENDPQAAEAQTMQYIADVGFPAMMQALFDDMFLDNANAKLKHRILQRALTLPEAFGAPLFSRVVGWDAGQLNTALSQIAVPLLVLQSTYFNRQRVRVPIQPGTITPWMERVQQHVPSARIDIVGDVGHFPMLEAADAVNDKIAAFVVQWS